MKLSSFSVILVFVVLVIVGAGITPLLSIQYTPTYEQKNISISYNWPGASARVIESEVTSKLEGVISAISGIKQVSSVSGKEIGRISITLKPKTSINAVRFEIASQIRRIYPKLPEGVSYPLFSASYSGENTSSVLLYTINAGIPTNQIEEYAKEHIVKQLSLIDGIAEINLSGATPYFIEVSFNPDYLRKIGVSPEDIASAISSYAGSDDVVGSIESKAILLTTSSKGSKFGQIPVKNVDGRIIRLDDITHMVYKEKEPTYYNRINGLNTINLSIVPEKGVNTIDICNRVKNKMKEFESEFPDKFSATLSYDVSKDLKTELNKILRRTILSFLFLLAFVFLATRSLRYLSIIIITLIANIFIAFIFYYLFKLQIHIYSLAGITVSLGMIIDSSIIMISHYGYFRDRKAFLAILGALFTTIGALTVIFFLPEKERVNLVEFSAVIIINLTVSLIISLLLVPALVDKLPVGGVRSSQSISSLRKTIRLNNFYKRYISFGRGHRWIFILLLIFGFGLPLHYLPSKIEKEGSFWDKAYNKTIGSSFYQNDIKNIAEKIFGGTLRLFSQNVKTYGYGREPAKKAIYIQAGLPDGCTTKQLNDIVMNMENFLTKFPQIKMFNTTISSYKNASIEVTFKKEYENSEFPLFLKQEVIAKAIDFGGATWAVYGIDENGFNNDVSSGSFGSNNIVITGYNYDQLYSYCLDAIKSLSDNQRVSKPIISGNMRYGEQIARNEYFIDYNYSTMALLGMTPADVYSALQEQLFNQNAASLDVGEEKVPVKVVSSNLNIFDVWNLYNEHLSIENEQDVKFSEIGEIEMRKSGNDIFKENQQYRLIVAYDFIGSYELASRVKKREIKRLNEEVLPIGYKAETEDYRWDFSKSKLFLLLFLVIAIIYFICSMLFESLLQPLLIILMIPLSLIGLFLTFYFTGYTFDQGGFAAMIMLCGISVNAGIYIINQYNILKKPTGSAFVNARNPLDLYIKAYNYKIIPILLTIISTVLGLLPFLFDGKDEQFWFSFAVGTMGGLIFSIIGIVFFLPVWRKI